MTHAAINREEESQACPLAGPEARPGRPVPWGIPELVLLPFALMLQLFCAFFAGKLDWLKRQRRTRPCRITGASTTTSSASPNGR